MKVKVRNKAKEIYNSNLIEFKKGLLDLGYKLSDKELHQITCFISIKYLDDIINLPNINPKMKEFYQRVKNAFIETIIS